MFELFWEYIVLKNQMISNLFDQKKIVWALPSIPVISHVKKKPLHRLHPSAVNGVVWLKKNARCGHVFAQSR